MVDISLPIKVVPGSQISEVVGRLGNRLKIKVNALPEGGRANQAVMQLVADELGIPVRQIQLVFGNSSPEKLLRIRLASDAEIVRIQKVINAWMS